MIDSNPLESNFFLDVLDKIWAVDKLRKIQLYFESYSSSKDYSSIPPKIFLIIEDLTKMLSCEPTEPISEDIKDRINNLYNPILGIQNNRRICTFETIYARLSDIKMRLSPSPKNFKIKLIAIRPS